MSKDALYEGQPGDRYFIRAMDGPRLNALTILSEPFTDSCDRPWVAIEEGGQVQCRLVNWLIAYGERDV